MKAALVYRLRAEATHDANNSSDVRNNPESDRGFPFKRVPERSTRHRPAAHLSRLLGEGLAHLHDHVFIRVLVRGHVDAGDPLPGDTEARAPLAPLRAPPPDMLARDAVNTHPSLGLEMLHTFGSQRAAPAVHDHPVRGHVTSRSVVRQHGRGRAETPLKHHRGGGGRGGVSLRVRSTGLLPSGTLRKYINLVHRRNHCMHAKNP